jgi:energy-coupling factor transporter ATP-binding protein EcfA2
VTIVLIDGRSGSGKTELAKMFARQQPEFQVVHLDDLYPGWDGLEAGSAQVPRLLVEGSWRAWDWKRNRAGGQHWIDLSRPLLVEGTGALSRASVALADLAIWVQLDDTQRKHRALSRDGETYAPHWDRWAAQEQRFITRENPRDSAHLVVDGTNGDSALRRVTQMLDGV